MVHFIQHFVDHLFHRVHHNGCCFEIPWRMTDDKVMHSQEVLVLGLLESEIFKGDIRPNLCVCVFVCMSAF